MLQPTLILRSCRNQKLKTANHGKNPKTTTKTARRIRKPRKWREIAASGNTVLPPDENSLFSLDNSRLDRKSSTGFRAGFPYA
uniref:Ribosomal protein L32 n=1 Tax=Romanomermis culicivorax TaxID=13658 RepID=A0A915JDI1_ROMCU